MKVSDGQCCNCSVNVLLQDCFLTMGPAWYQSLIKVLLSRFPQSCRHFDDNGIQYLVRKKEFKVANPQAPVSMSFPSAVASQTGSKTLPANNQMKAFPFMLRVIEIPLKNIGNTTPNVISKHSSVSL